MASPSPKWLKDCFPKRLPRRRLWSGLNFFLDIHPLHIDLIETRNFNVSGFYLSQFANFEQTITMNLTFLVIRRVLFALVCVFSEPAFSQTLIHHSTNWFGPNANPVPEFTDATIPQTTSISVFADRYFGHGDQTETFYLSAEIPLIPQKVSVKIWTPFIEHYQVADDEYARRMMLEEKSGFSTGDLYFQTRISLAKELRARPAVILNTTLKTASGTGFRNRRYFNTAGYYFDLEAGKSFSFTNFFIDELRLVGNLGFYSWDVQTPQNNVQDDAVMYGCKVILKNEKWSWENTFSGYNGWINRAADYGNKPLVVASRLNYFRQNLILFLQYQHGVRHFPYEQIRFGTTLRFRSLTPNFLK